MMKTPMGKPALCAGFALAYVCAMIAGCSSDPNGSAQVAPTPTANVTPAPVPSDLPKEARDAIKAGQEQSAAMQKRALEQGEAMRKAQQANPR